MDKHIDSFDELINFLNELVNTNDVTYIYRGYNNDDEIYPAIIRKKDYSKYEERLLNEFEKYGLAYFSPNNHMEFLSYAQHFGLPTRLLDFTYNPFIALFFALHKKEKEDPYYKIIYCDIKDCVTLKNDVNYTKHQIKNFESHQISPFEKMQRTSYTNELMSRFRNFGLSDKIKIVTPNFTNQRIMMQEGLFMVPTTLDRTRHKEIIERNTNRILINKSIRKEVIQYLDKIGFNSYKLMPDLASVCYAVNKKIIGESYAEED